MTVFTTPGELLGAFERTVCPGEAAEVEGRGSQQVERLCWMAFPAHSHVRTESETRLLVNHLPSVNSPLFSSLVLEAVKENPLSWIGSVARSSADGGVSSVDNCSGMQKDGSLPRFPLFRLNCKRTPFGV